MYLIDGIFCRKTPLKLLKISFYLSKIVKSKFGIDF